MNERDAIVRDLEEKLRPVSRRAFLGGSLTAGAATATMGLVGCSTEFPGRPGDIKDLDDKEYAIMHKLTRVILPMTPETGFVSLEKVPVLKNLDDLFATFPAKLRGDLSTGLALFNYGALVIGWHFKSFLSLNDEDALSYARAWESGSTNLQRGLFTALKQVIILSYWKEPVTWGPVGYKGPFTKPNGIPRIGNRPLPASDTPADPAAKTGSTP